MNINADEILKSEAEVASDNYDESCKQAMLRRAKTRENHREETNQRIKEISEQGLTGTDDGFRYDSLPPKSAGRRLTAKEIMFCRFYVATRNINQSLKLAGFKEPRRYVHLINKVDIKAFISELTNLRLEQLGYDKYTVIQNLAIIANQDVSDYIELKEVERTSKDGKQYTRKEIHLKDFPEINKTILVDEFGEPILDADGNEVVISSDKTKAIKNIKYNDNGQIIVEYHDKMQALKMLANMLDMEGSTKITLNDETRRQETEKSLLEKLKRLKQDQPNQTEQTNQQSEGEIKNNE